MISKRTCGGAFGLPCRLFTDERRRSFFFEEVMICYGEVEMSYDQAMFHCEEVMTNCDQVMMKFR